MISENYYGDGECNDYAIDDDESDHLEDRLDENLDGK